MTTPNYNFSNDMELLNTLADAISDVGYWSWWTEQLPDLFQIEFGGSQLYFPPLSPEKPPQTQIAIRFYNPTSIHFISKIQNDKFEWIDLLHEDKIEPPTCSHGDFSFGASDQTVLLLEQAKSIKTILGPLPTKDTLLVQSVSLVFWCGEIGFNITSNTMGLFNHSGEVPLNEMQTANAKWWEYWREYWDKRESKHPLPKDYACEVTIPLKS